MEIIGSDVEYLGMCPSNETQMLSHIELCGRQCYQSEHRIDPASKSYERFFSMLVSKGHISAIEHSNVVVEFSLDDVSAFEMLYASFTQSALTQMSYFRVMPSYEELKLVVSGNVRAWYEFIQRKWWFLPYAELSDFLSSEYPMVFSKLNEFKTQNLEYRLNISELDEEREALGEINMRIVPDHEQQLNFDIYDQYDIPIYTFMVTTDRGISHEIVRHRVLSFSQESTRYVNYKSNGVQLIDWPVPDELRSKYTDVMNSVNELYNELIIAGVKPQYARNVLPHSTKTSIAISGRMSGWAHFVELRDSPAAHPEIRSIAKYIKDILGVGESDS